MLLSAAGNVFASACIRGLIPIVAAYLIISTATVYINGRKKDPTGAAGLFPTITMGYI